MKRPQAPCKDCQDRFVGCHIICDKYIKFNHECEVFREEKHRMMEETRILNDIENRRKKLTATGQMYRKRRKK